MTAWRIINSWVYGKHLYLRVTYQLVSWKLVNKPPVFFCLPSHFCSHPRVLKSCNCPKKAHLSDIPHPAVLWGRHHISLSTCCFETPWRHSRRPVPSACTWKTFLSLVVESSVRSANPQTQNTERNLNRYPGANKKRVLKTTKHHPRFVSSWLWTKPPSFSCYVWYTMVHYLLYNCAS